MLLRIAKKEIIQSKEIRVTHNEQLGIEVMRNVDLTYLRNKKVIVTTFLTATNLSKKGNKA